MSQMPFICVYVSYLDSLCSLSDVSLGKLFRGMIHYAKNGEEPELTGSAALLWPMIRFQMDQDQKKYRSRCEANRLNGVKGGRPAKTEKNRWVSEKPKENANENNNDNKNENERDKDNETADLAQSLSTPISFIPPDHEQVSQYIREQGLTVNPTDFLDHYTSNGWMVGQSPMQDWKASIRRWHRKENEHGKTVLPPESYQYGTVL